MSARFWLSAKGQIVSATPSAPAQAGFPATISVTALTTHIKLLLESDALLRDVWITGEVSNWKRAASGHIYFALKDGSSSISAVMWRSAAVSHTWLPSDGDQVIAHGSITVYPERGVYQITVNRLRPAGRGQLYAAFEQLKAKLAAEGLFDAERKRPIPPRPRRIGLVTSADAAALHDFIVFHTLVMGAEAPAQLVAALTQANRYSREVEPIDTLIIARGGGAIEDLWAFNDEAVARAVAASALPVIAGVGHETDVTIVDFVADLRAPTPTGAAVVATPNGADELLWLREQTRLCAEEALAIIAEERAQLLRAERRLRQVHPIRLVELQIQRLDERQLRLGQAIGRRVERTAARLALASARLTAFDPRAVLARGYSIVQRANGEVVTAPAQSVSGEMLAVLSAGGRYRVERKDAHPAGDASVSLGAQPFER
jgi:exodeoxyribonuclease VII large subunit